MLVVERYSRVGEDAVEQGDGCVVRVYEMQSAVGHDIGEEHGFV